MATPSLSCPQELGQRIYEASGAEGGAAQAPGPDDAGSAGAAAAPAYSTDVWAGHPEAVAAAEAVAAPDGEAVEVAAGPGGAAGKGKKKGKGKKPKEEPIPAAWPDEGRRLTIGDCVMYGVRCSSPVGCIPRRLLPVVNFLTFHALRLLRQGRVGIINRDDGSSNPYKV